MASKFCLKSVTQQGLTRPTIRQRVGGYSARLRPAAWCGSKGAYDRTSCPCHYRTYRDGLLRQGAVDEAKADDQRHAGERQHHHPQVWVTRLAASSEKLFMTRPPKTVPQFIGEKKRAAGVVRVRRLVLTSCGLTGLLNPCVKSGTKLFQPYVLNCFNCASSLRRSSTILEGPGLAGRSYRLHLNLSTG